MDYKALGEQMKVHRKRLELTQKQVASSAQLSTSYYGHLERGTRKASIESLLSIAHIFGTSPDVLLSEEVDHANRIPMQMKDCVKEMRHMLDQLETYCVKKKLYSKP